MRKRMTTTTLTLGNLKHRKKHYTVLIIGIILAMLFSSGTLFFISCMKSSEDEIKYRRQGKQDFIVFNTGDIDFSDPIENNNISGDIGYIHTISYALKKDEEKGDGYFLGWLDERGKELYYQRLKEGKMPENDGEIAVEKNTLYKLGKTLKLGDKITLDTYPVNGSDIFENKSEKTYTVVGILDDKKYYLQMSTDEQGVVYLPSIFVCDNQEGSVGGKENLIALIKATEIANLDYSPLYNILEKCEYTSTDYIHSLSIGDSYTNISTKTSAFAFLSLLLTFASGVAIANSFSSNLKERKNQIGMLRAVGATKRQIMKIFAKEALIISLVTTPLSTALSYFCVKLFVLIMGDSYVFLPNFTILILGALFGIICVMASALIPLISITKLTPMQAIRDIEIMRKFKNKKIKSKKNYNLPYLLAKRNLTFSTSRKIAVCILLCVTTVVSCFSLSFLQTVRADAYTTSYDYEIFSRGKQENNYFINEANSQSPIDENSVRECLDIEHISSVSGSKEGFINIIIEGEYPEYLRINEFSDFEHASRFTHDENIRNITAENIEMVMNTGINPQYTYVKNAVGYENEIFNSTLIAKTSDVIKELEDDLLYGKINIDKLNSGAEIIITAPDKIGYSFTNLSSGASMSGIVNLSSDDNTSKSSFNQKRNDNVILTAQSPFKVGDTLTVSYLSADANGTISRKDSTVKIGAILGSKYYSSNFSVFTTIDGLNKLGGSELDYANIYLNADEDITGEINETITTELSNIFTDKGIISTFLVRENEKQEYNSISLAVISLIVIFSAISLSLINNAVSSQIRHSKRTIGTLRAVGASQRELSKTYIIEVLYLNALGFITGIVSYTVLHYIVEMTLQGTKLPFFIWHIFLIMLISISICLINVKAKIKFVTKNSIVENIREL